MYDSRARERRRQIEEQEALAAQLLRQVSCTTEAIFHTKFDQLHLLKKPFVNLTNLSDVFVFFPSVCLKKENVAPM